MRRRRIHAPAFLMTFAAAGAVASAGCGKVASDPEPVVHGNPPAAVPDGGNPPGPLPDGGNPAACPASLPDESRPCTGGDYVCQYSADNQCFPNAVNIATCANGAWSVDLGGVGGCNPPAPPVDAAASCPAEQPAANGMCPSGLVCTYAVDGGTCNGAPVSDSVTVTCGPMGWYESAGSSSSCNPPAQFPDAGEDAEADGGP
jgi:hypothetical protein